MNICSKSLLLYQMEFLFIIFQFPSQVSYSDSDFSWPSLTAGLGVHMKVDMDGAAWKLGQVLAILHRSERKGLTRLMLMGRLLALSTRHLRSSQTT